MPAKDEMPGTLQRSPAKARRTWAKAHDSAVGSYGEGERAHRTAGHRSHLRARRCKSQ